MVHKCWGGSRIFLMGVHFERGGSIGLQAKKGGPGGGLTFGTMLKSLQHGQKGGGGVRTPWTPLPLDPPMKCYMSTM